MDTDDSWEVTDQTNLIAVSICLGIPTGCAFFCYLYVAIKKYMLKKQLLKRKQELQELIVYNPMTVQPP